MPAFDHTEAFATWWSRTFPGTQCPVLPKKPDDLTLSARMAMESDNPILYQNLFGGIGSTNLPADTVMRRNSAQLQASDIPHLRAAGLEYEAQQLERQMEREEAQRIGEQTLASRQNFESERARFAAYNEQGLLGRMLNNPLTPDQIAANRRKYGIKGN